MSFLLALLYTHTNKIYTHIYTYIYTHTHIYTYILPGGSDCKESVYNAGDLGWEDPLEGMATHSSILDWRITWTEEPGRLQSMGSQKV